MNRSLSRDEIEMSYCGGCKSYCEERNRTNDDERSSMIQTDIKDREKGSFVRNDPLDLVSKRETSCEIRIFPSSRL